jgi:hypothetical protein
MYDHQQQRTRADNNTTEAYSNRLLLLQLS